MNMLNQGRRLLVIMAMMTMTACSKQQGLPEDTMVAQISGYNHTGDYIHRFYVDQGGGHNMLPYEGGGSFTCCITYPRDWREGMQAKVRWTTSSPDPKATGAAAEGTWHESIVPIDRYTQPGTTLNVHFLPEGKVRLIITSGSVDQENYPIPPPEANRPPNFKW